MSYTYHIPWFLSLMTNRAIAILYAWMLFLFWWLFCVNFFFDVQISYCTIHNKMRLAVPWSLFGLLVWFQNMPTEVSGAKILILHPLYAGSHELVLRYRYNIKDGQANFFSKSANQNPQIPRLILLSQIRKFLRCASLQIANPHVCYTVFVGRKSMHLRTCGRVKSADHKKWFHKAQFRKVPHFRKTAKVTSNLSPQICDLWNLFVDRPPLYNMLHYICSEYIQN